MNNLLKRLYHIATLDWLFRWQYARFSQQAIQKNKVVFVETHRQGLSNSLAYLYQELERQGEYQLVVQCLSESGKEGKYVRDAIHCLWEIATAKYVVLSEASRVISCIRLRPETKVLQLWHACGAFKRFGLSTAKLKFGGDYKENEKYPYYKNLDLVTVSSPEVAWAYSEAMNIPLESNIIQATGISRTDVFFNEDFKAEAKKRIEAILPKGDKRKWLLWAPTFRGNTNAASAPEYPDLEAMKEAIGDDYILLIKHHPFVKNLPEIPVDVQDFAFDVSDSCDISDLICSCDMCISDYSSLVFEYSLMERPMIFFATDKEDYEDWRGFYYSYEELTSGPIVTNTDDLIEAIKEMTNNFYPSEVIAFREKFMSACDGKATERIMSYLQQS
jgi:Putative glycosyl/glycerophosphate transferases involved in teichoic acid biosynthesis TagF/TagB/EpsJ/RodC